MRAFRCLLTGLVGFALTTGTMSVLSGCGDDSSATGTQVQESQESKNETKRIMDAMQKNMQKSTQKGASKSAAKK